MKKITRRYIVFNDDAWNVINILANGLKIRKQDSLHVLLRISIRTKQVQGILKRCNVSAAYLKALSVLQ